MKYKYNGVHLSETKSGELDDEKNIIEYDGNTYILKYLSQHKISKGGNSNVYLLQDKLGKEKDKVVKISNYYKPRRNAPETIKKRHGRFINEIEALNVLKEKQAANIVQIDFNDVIEVDDEKYPGQIRQVPYYVMEKADTDLKEYLLSNTEIDEQDRVQFCLDIFNAIEELHEENFYHRDIKPDNILLFFNDSDHEKSVWKLGDLGLLRHRDKDYDDIGEKIGPIGWLSPEAMNKILTEKIDLSFDCKIDEKSDIFQLGKLFWFIFQLNVPIGQVCFEDFVYTARHKKDIYELLFEMLKYSKSTRADRAFVGFFLNDIGKKYGLA